MQDCRNLVLHNSILNFDAEQVYLKVWVTNVKNKESLNPNPRENWPFKTQNPKPKTQNPNPQH